MARYAEKRYSQRMSWVDPVIDEIKTRFEKEISAGKTLIIRDEKTLSGRVHVGSLRGVAIHGLISEVLTQQGIKNEFLFELNDFDPMDGLPVNIDPSYQQYMGLPLFKVPAHEAGAENYPMVFGHEFEKVTQALGFPIKFYTVKPLYLEGKFNDVIRQALDNADKIRKIYKEVSGGGKPDDWYPLNVICENCGKVGTTQVTSWDGTNVTYECKKLLVKWAQGCEHKGTISPFDGRAKLPWKVEWPAKWKVMNVNIEGAGKDHSAAGGSRQIGARIVKDVFNYPNPFDIPYEFFNLAGKKMSASKGLGASAKEVSDLLPPKLLKLLMIRKQPNHPIDFDPEGNTIPNLFDEYDRLSDHYFKRHPKPEQQFARTFALAQIDTTHAPKDLWQMRFTTLSFVVQMPHLNLIEEAEKLKGSKLTNDEIDALNERALYVKKWLDQYAAPEYTFTIQNGVPEGFTISDMQKVALSALAEKFASTEWEGGKIQEAIHAVKTETGVEPKELFQPLYQLFLGRNSGPQVGWFLSTFAKEDVINRLKSATR